MKSEPEDASSVIYQQLRPIFRQLSPELPLNHYTHENLIKYMEAFSETDVNGWRNLVDSSIKKHCINNDIELFNYHDLLRWINNDVIQPRYLDIVEGLYKSYAKPINKDDWL